MRPAHAEGEHPDQDDLAVAEGDAVEPGLGRAVVVLDEEAVEEVERVEGERAHDRRPAEGDHLTPDRPVQAPDEVAYVLLRADDEQEARRGERGDHDPLDPELPDGDEEDGEGDVRDPARQGVECERPRLPPQARERHRDVDDVRQVEVDQGDHDQARVDRIPRDRVGEAVGEEEQTADQHGRVDRLDQEEERDRLLAPARVVSVEVEAGENAAQVDEDVDERREGQDELEDAELGGAQVARVERDEEERERLQEDANAAVDGRVVGERAKPEPARDLCVLARFGLQPFLGSDLAHGPTGP